MLQGMKNVLANLFTLKTNITIFQIPFSCFHVSK
jgi:hypothetical protein